MPGNSARVVEMEVTSKLEAMLSRVKDLEKIESTSSNGWGEIHIRMNKHADMDVARFEISTIIRQTWPALPREAGYPVISVNRADDNANRPFMAYTINAPATPIIIQQLTESQIKPRLAQIEGIDQIDVSGAQPMEWQLTYDNSQLKQLGITQSEVEAAIRIYLANEMLGLASVETKPGEKQWLRVTLTAAPKSHLFDISQIRVKSIEGKIIYLNQLVTATHIEKKPSSYYRINGLNSIYLSITADQQANQLDVSKKIKTLLASLSLPPGYELHLSYDATEYIQNELEKVYFRTCLTLLILLLFVLLIYRSFKYLLLITISLAFNVAIALIGYYFLQLEIQLYSLAGITISLTFIIDNTIVMSDQLIRRNNMKAFLAILTATITTIVALGVIFFLEEKLRLNLQDFAYAIIVNLAVSLFVALFLVPALIDKLRLVRRRRNKNRRLFAHSRLFSHLRGKRKLIYFNRTYTSFCRFTWRWRVWVVVLLVLAFGIPVFLLPEKIEEESRWGDCYNQTFGSSYYKEKLKPVLDKALGGTLRLFIQKVYTGSYDSNREETSLYVTATLPNGATTEQMNQLMQQMERYLSRFEGIKQFQTTIHNANRASLIIHFTKESLRSGFPYTLRFNIITRSLELGGGSWAVHGFGEAFSNDVRDNAGSYQVEMFGYNYDELAFLADKFKDRLLQHQRIKEVIISSEFSWFKDDYLEYHFHLHKEQLARKNILPLELYHSVKSTFGRQINAGYIVGEYGLEQVLLSSGQSKDQDIWSLLYAKENASEKTYKLSELAQIEKRKTSQKIIKVDQQYRLCLQYEYIGTHEQGRKHLQKNLEEFRNELPLGYTIDIQDRYWFWRSKAKNQYGLLALVFVIIYFTCSILFNSLKQPFSILFVIPVSYIGIFLTFYLFKLNFDQGGFAAFVLLCGITINANIYLINEYNNRLAANPTASPLKTYLKAWNAKISPIFLTIISTILGFIPFMIGEEKEAFWFPLAAGTIGGLVVSFIAIVCFLPLFMGVAKRKKEGE